jgi:hypothetical protein
MTKLTTVHFVSTGRLGNTCATAGNCHLPVVALPFSFDKDLNDSQIYLRSVPGTKGVQENYLLRKICPKKLRPFTDEH